MSIKEEVSPFMDFGDAYSQSCSVERDENKKSDVSYISHQPRPVAVSLSSDWFEYACPTDCL